uniref:Uncharacterized protein n=1 Tax=Kalanchoe fedtschenkoi TaxID=63787 RepID=A0A7N0V290_KALFE
MTKAVIKYMPAMANVKYMPLQDGLLHGRFAPIRCARTEPQIASTDYIPSSKEMQQNVIGNLPGTLWI